MLKNYISKISKKLDHMLTKHRNMQAYIGVIKKGFNHLNYGYWETERDNPKIIQENLYKKIRACIPYYVTNVLDVGGGIGGIANLLTNDGFKVFCIVPDKELVHYGKKRFPQVNFIREKAEYFYTESKFDLVLMVESYSRIANKFTALSNVLSQLANQGAIIISDSFTKSREEQLVEYLHTKNFYLETRLDITKHIIPSFYYAIEEKLFKGKFLDQWKIELEDHLSSKKYYLLIKFELKPQS